MSLFNKLAKTVESYISAEHMIQLKNAYDIACTAHKNQKRYSGEPYVTHPLEVAIVLGQMSLDHETLIAALLHDVIEDTTITYHYLEQQFGTSVASLVEGVSKLDKLKFRNRQEEKVENFCKMIIAMAQDIRVTLIKLADRLHNMRTIDALRASKQRRIAKETLEIYSPLAHRLGIHHLKIELEELSFKTLYPSRYRVLKNVVKIAHGNRKELIESVVEEIKLQLKDSGIACQANGREKHLYSIYQKMLCKEQRFHSIMDIYAFRIIVKDVETCYRVLGQIHALYKPRPGRFKDYIAIPKANGYQSLHTSMIGPHGIPLEIQIRTEDMDQIAEIGVAAHWSYKQSGDKVTPTQLRVQHWMESLLELQKSVSNSTEFIESVKSALFPEEIYLFTPQGHIVELPIGATPVDFAYAVHTDIGHACIGARVDRKPYPLSQPLATGQTVEIITSSNARPSAVWMNFVVSYKARAKIRHRLKTLGRNDAIKLGRNLLVHALGYPLEHVKEDRLQHLLASMKLDSLEALLAQLGLGNAMSVVIAHRLSEYQSVLPTSYVGHNKLPIRHTEGIIVTFAKCCRPIPGDPITAYISQGKGLVVHHEFCRNIHSNQKDTEKLMAVEWEDHNDQEFITELRVDLINYQGVLAHIIKTITLAKSTIYHLTTEERDSRVYHVHFQITVHDRMHLANIMRKIRKIPNIIKVSRNRN